MPDPRDSKIIDMVNHAAVNPYSLPPRRVEYAPRTFITFAAAQPDHPLHEWDRQVIGEMPGMWNPPDQTLIGLTNPWNDPSRPFLNFEVVAVWSHSGFVREVVVTLPEALP
jgi:hypothetical protein